MTKTTNFAPGYFCTENLVCDISVPIILGIPVAELALDGRYTTETYINHTLGIGPNNLDDFTLCLRFFVYFLKSANSGLLSYSTSFDDNSLNVELVKSAQTLLLFICKYIKLDQGCGYYKTNNLRSLHREWNHICMSLKTEIMDADLIQVSTKIYLNGNLVQKGNILIHF